MLDDIFNSIQTEHMNQIQNMAYNLVYEVCKPVKYVLLVIVFLFLFTIILNVLTLFIIYKIYKTKIL